MRRSRFLGAFGWALLVFMITHAVINLPAPAAPTRTAFISTWNTSPLKVKCERSSGKVTLVPSGPSATESETRPFVATVEEARALASALNEAALEATP